jgi:hypothetical protein
MTKSTEFNLEINSYRPSATREIPRVLYPLINLESQVKYDIFKNTHNYWILPIKLPSTIIALELKTWLYSSFYVKIRSESLNRWLS